MLNGRRVVGYTVLSWFLVFFTVWSLAELYGFSGFFADKPTNLVSVIQPKTPFLDRGIQPIEIVALGTSLSANQKWLADLEKEIRSCSGRPVIIADIAKPGANSSFGLRSLTTLLQKGMQPSLILIEFSINDASVYHGLPLFQSLSNHKKMIENATNANIPTFLMTMSPAWGINTLERPGFSKYQKLYRELAHDTTSGLIDTSPLWQGLSYEQRTLWIPDGLHPVYIGLEEVFQPVIYKALRNFLC